MASRTHALSALAAVVVSALAASERVLAQPDPNNPNTCVDALGCSLLGDCVNNQCVCDEGWTGPACSQPDLILENDLEGMDDPLHPTWGGMSIYADNQWHFFGEYIQNQCSIWDYGTNSAFMRATGDSPAGPFTYQETVLPPFHHGVQVSRAPDGSYLLFGDGRSMPSSTVLNNCNVFSQGSNSINRGGKKRGLEAGAGEGDANDDEVAGDGDEDDDSAEDLDDSTASAEVKGAGATRRRLLRGKRSRRNQSGLYPWGDSPQDAHIAAVSSSIYGPWEEHVIMHTDLSGGVNSWYCNMTNLSPVVLPNGTVVMAFRSKPCVENLNSVCGKGCQNIGIAVSENGWAGPFIRRPNPIPTLQGNEDPFLWTNKRGWLMLMHGKTQCGRSQADTNTCGTLAYSVDSYTWYLSPWPAYTGVVQFAPDSPTRSAPETLLYRQRPKITFDNFGTPLVLYNSAQRFSRPYVQNLAFRFNTEPMRDNINPPPCPPNPSFKSTCTVNVRNIPRNLPGCQLQGKQNCVWCPLTSVDGVLRKPSCMYGGDAGICSSSDPSLYYAHC